MADTLELVVDDAFLLRGRGWVLAPSIPVDRWPANTVLAIEIVEPDGAARSIVGRFVVEHLQLTGGASRWQGVIVLPEDARRVPPGSRLRCRSR